MSDSGLVLTSFAPVISAKTRVLILGSMPGERSLGAQQYYAHPRNLFWPIIGGLLGFPRDLPYPDRLARLTAAGIGLWDVLRHCQRPGSLDAAIVRTTEVPNDFPWLLDRCPDLRLICFNGQKAAVAFRRHVLPNLPDWAGNNVGLATLPSTSPAHASIGPQQKLAEWRRVLTPGRPD